MQVVTLIHKGKVRTISLDDLRKMKVELTQQWEDLCCKCGKCCFDKILNGNGVLVINYNKPCQHLSFLGKRAMCSVYSDRFSKAEKGCFTIPEAIQKRILPSGCPYLKSSPAYKAPVDNGEWYKRARKKLRVGRYDDDYNPAASSPTAGTSNAPVMLPPRITSMEAQQLAREDLTKPRDWKRRQLERKKRSEGKIGILDPREKTNYNIKPSGHALGG